MGHGKYFPHIDGIRTIAVIAVVIYHIFGFICPGGFVGVDVFFVISGYLITGGILKSLDENSFSIKDFYTRRIRRIIPAYVVLVSFVLIVSLLLFPPILSGRVFTSTVSSAVFATNIFLYLKTGYFDPSSETNPLLHLWSLGVEEQFYIFIPLFLFVIYRKNRNWMFRFLLILFSASLILSLLCVWTSNNNFNFYMLPARAWELLAGSLLAYWGRRSPLPVGNSSGMGGVLGGLGMLVALGTVFLYNSSLPFPGASAIPPVAGACLMIRWGNRGFAGKILESPLFVGIGKISYSLYLWHWPLLVFWNYISDDSRNPLGLSCVFMLSLLMGWLSWKYVEMPVRVSRKWNFKRAMVWASAGCGLLAMAACVFIVTNFTPSWIRGAVDSEGTSCYQATYTKMTREAPDFGSFENYGNYVSDQLLAVGEDESPSYLLWGDSHATALFPGLDRAAGRWGVNGLFINRRHYFVAYEAFGPENAESVNVALDFIQKHTELKTVFLVNRWSLLAEGVETRPPFEIIRDSCAGKAVSSPEALKEGLERVCRRLNEMGRRVVIVSTVPEQLFDVPVRCIKNGIFGMKMPIGVSYEQFQKRQKATRAILQEMEKSGLAKVIWVDDFFFPEKRFCRIFDENGALLYSDNNHLNMNGSRALLEYFQAEFEKEVKP